jgi:hypothetical protein
VNCDAELRSWSLTPRAGFLLSFVDGQMTIETLLAASGMQAEEALAILEDLLARGIVQLN